MWLFEKYIINVFENDIYKISVLLLTTYIYIYILNIFFFFLSSYILNIKY